MHMKKKWQALTKCVRTCPVMEDDPLSQEGIFRFKAASQYTWKFLTGHYGASSAPNLALMGSLAPYPT